MRKLLVATMLVLAGCGTGPAAGQNAHAYRLYVEGLGGGVEVVTTSPTGRVSLPSGFLTADGSQLYTSGGQVFGGSAGLGGMTILNSFDSRTGSQVRRVEAPGTWTLAGGGTSPDGHWLVLTGSSPAQAGSFLVLDTGPLGRRYTVAVGAQFNFDAISNDGSKLYLIQTLAGTAYHVRLFNVFTNTLQIDPVFVKSNAVEAMNGYKITAVADPSGHVLYSLYGRNDGQPPFVHALDLEAGVAYCIDLPAIAAMTRAYQFADSSGWALSLDSDHHVLYASSSAGQVVAIDTNGNNVIRSASVSPPRAVSWLPHFVVEAQAKALDDAPAASAVDPSGRWLYVAWEHGYLTIDTRNLRAVTQLDRADVLSSLAASPDGRHLFAVVRSGSVADLDPRSGTRKATVTGVGQPWRILRLEPLPGN